MNLENNYDELGIEAERVLKKESTSQDRRKYVRIDYIFDVDYEILLEIQNNKEKGITKDISLGGVAFQISSLDTKLQKDSIIVIRLSIKELIGELKAVGRVVRIWEEENQGIKKKFCAVKFVTIDPYDYEILEDFIDQYLKKQKR